MWLVPVTDLRVYIKVFISLILIASDEMVIEVNIRYQRDTVLKMVVGNKMDTDWKGNGIPRNRKPRADAIICFIAFADDPVVV